VDINDLTTQLVEAASASGKSLFEKAKTFLIPELTQVATRIVSIEASLKSGEMSPKIAKELMVMQVDSAVDVLVAMTELTVFEAEKLINAAIKAIAGVVNTAVGFKIV
jgi:uncharacterized protein YjgD (DUF1641 family)